MVGEGGVKEFRIYYILKIKVIIFLNEFSDPN